MEQHKHRTYKIIILTIVGVLWFFAMGRAAYALGNSDMVLRGVHIGSQDFSGMTRDAVRETLLAFQSRLSLSGFTFTYQDTAGAARNVTVYPFVYQNEGADSRDFAGIDIEKTADAVWGVGRQGGWLRKFFERAATRLYGTSLRASLVVDTNLFRNALRANIASDEHPARDARVVYEQGVFRTEHEEIGVVYDLESGITRASTLLRKLALAPIPLAHTIDTPHITELEIMPFLSGFSRITEAGDIIFTYSKTEPKEELTWPFEKDRIAAALVLKKHDDGTLAIDIDGAALGKWVMETIAPAVETPARDAKFRIEGNRVVEFQSSQSGVALDMQGLLSALTRLVQERSMRTASDPLAPKDTAALLVTKSEPSIKTGDVNDLGIKELLGIGTSSWKGSPANRIKNIRNGMSKLNGILIKPGEEFSLLAALRPFTLAGGYLPELVIKGDKIEPEIGGGLCQIGTTSFRMAMNSGMPITARTNHGLVVTYYNDPSNGNPGTDATIYDPWPDFRFINDTGHYLLWTTHMDDGHSKLEFSLWGTSDGRKGHYSAPVVQSWIATGPMKEIETTDLPVGARKCQARHPGAVASFTYTIDLPNDEKKDMVYKSYYRPLPEICSIGVEKKTEDEVATAPPAETPASILDGAPIPVAVDDISG